MDREVQSKSGHRERLKAHFVAGEKDAYTYEALLELEREEARRYIKARFK